MLEGQDSTTCTQWPVEPLCVELACSPSVCVGHLWVISRFSGSLSQSENMHVSSFGKCVHPVTVGTGSIGEPRKWMDTCCGGEREVLVDLRRKVGRRSIRHSHRPMHERLSA